MTTPLKPPDWAFEFHGHRCPFMPIGYRMGVLAMERLGVEREKDHGFFVFPELGEGHPQTCMMDGIQAATGATYGKAAHGARPSTASWRRSFYHPEQGRRALRAQADFMDEMGKHEFFAYRKRGVEPSEIPADGHRRGHRLDRTSSPTRHLQRPGPARTSPTRRSRARSTRPSARAAASTSSTATCA